MDKKNETVSSIQIKYQIHSLKKTYETLIYVYIKIQNIVFKGA